MLRWPRLVAVLLCYSAPAAAVPLRVAVAFVRQFEPHPSITGLLQLEVPLDRIAQPREPPPPSADDTDSAEREEVVQPESAESSPAPRAPTVHVAGLDVGAVREVVREALRLRGDPRTRERLEGLAGRARASALLPELTFRAARSTDRTLRLAPSGVDRYEVTQTGGGDLLFEARASWTLNRLIFADEELRIEHLRAAHTEATQSLALLVVKHVVAWHRARAELASGLLDSDAAFARTLELFQAEAILDVLTDGFFQRRVIARIDVSATAPSATVGRRRVPREKRRPEGRP